MQSAQQVLDTLQSIPAVNFVRELSARESVKGFLVSGALRDLFIGVAPGSYHFVVEENPVEFGRKLLGLVGGHIGERRSAQGVISRYYGELGELYFYSSKGLSIDDYMGRYSDFTINALAFDVHGNRLLEFHEAIQDIERRLIRLVSPIESISNAPVVLLRAVSLALSSPRFSIAPQTLLEIESNRELLAQATPYNVDDELSKILTSGRYLEGVRTLNDLGLLPELLKTFLPCALPDDRPGTGAEGTFYPLETFAEMATALDKLLPRANAFLEKNLYLLRLIILLTPWMRRSLPEKTSAEVKTFLIDKGDQMERDLHRLSSHATLAFRTRMVAVGYLAGVASVRERGASIAELQEAVGRTGETFGAWKGLLSSVLMCADWLTSEGGDFAAEGDALLLRQVLQGEADALAARSARVAPARG